MPIHPTAVIDPKAELDSTVDVGPYAIIEGPVRIGPRTRVFGHAYICGWTEIGEDCQIHPFSTVGNFPQDFHYTGERSYCRVGNRVLIREGASIHRGTQPESSTVIGDECLLMAYSHIGHNCILGRGTKVYNLAQLAGHVEVDENAIFSAWVGVHQFVRVGTLALVVSGTRLVCDLPPFMMAFGESTVIQHNVIGMRRNGYDEQAVQEIREAFRTLYRRGLPFTKAVDELAASVQTRAGQKLVDFLRAPSKRGHCAAGVGHRTRRKHGEAED